MRKLHLTLASLAAIAMSTSLAVGVAAQDASTEPGDAASDQIVGVYSIEDMSWLLTSQVVDGEMQPVPDGITVSLYMQDGKAGGSSGCNNYFTTYLLDGFDLSFGEVGSTMMACPEPAMGVESAFLANLAAVTAYQSGGIQMALLGANGDLLLEFDLAPEPSVIGSWVAQGINNGDGAVESGLLTPTVTAEFTLEGLLSGSDGCNRYATTYEIEGDSITISPEITSTRKMCADPAIGELSGQYYAALAAATTWSTDAGGALELRDDEGALQVRYDRAE
jgi:heat shock protein HslJ